MSRLSKLQPIELKALDLLAKGFTSEEMAKELKVLPRTANNYLTKARRKTGVQTNLALLILLEDSKNEQTAS